jgi:hypothetical protein
VRTEAKLVEQVLKNEVEILREYVIAAQVTIYSQIVLHLFLFEEVRLNIILHVSCFVVGSLFTSHRRRRSAEYYCEGEAYAIKNYSMARSECCQIYI